MLENEKGKTESDHIKETNKIKEYFDGQLGFNVYELFPDIEI